MPITQQAWHNRGSAPLRKTWTRTYPHTRHRSAFSLPPCLLLSSHFNSCSRCLSLSAGGQEVRRRRAGGEGGAHCWVVSQSSWRPHTISRAVFLLPRWPEPVPSPLLSMNRIGPIKESHSRAASCLTWKQCVDGTADHTRAHGSEDGKTQHAGIAVGITQCCLETAACQYNR